MPYVSDPNLDPNQQNSGGGAQPQPAGQVSGQPSAVSGSTGTQSQVQNSNSATEAPKAPTLAPGTGITTPGLGENTKVQGGAPSYDSAKPTSSGQWTNLQNYLNANNGGQFGQQFAGNVGNDVNQAQTAITNAAQNFKTAVDSNTIQNNQGVIDQVGTAPEKMSSDDQDAFKKQLNGSYQGPQSAGSDSAFQRAHAQSKSAYEESQQAQTPGGQTALLQKFYNTPTYTPGSQALDSAILSSDPNAQAAIQSLAKQASGIPVSYQNAATAASSEAAAGASQSAAAHEAAVAALYGTGGSAATPNGGAIGNLENTVNQRVSADNTAADPAYGAALNALKSNNLSSLTPDQLKWLGDVSNFKGALYGIDPTAYLTKNAANATTNTVITPEEQARLQALYDLAGEKNSFAPDASKAGTVQNPYTFNNTKDNGFGAAVEKARQDWTSQVTAAEKQRMEIWNKLDEQRKITAGFPQSMGNKNTPYMDILASQLADYDTKLRQLYSGVGPQYDFATGQRIAAAPKYPGDAA